MPSPKILIHVPLFSYPLSIHVIKQNKAWSFWGLMRYTNKLKSRTCKRDSPSMARAQCTFSLERQLLKMTLRFFFQIRRLSSPNLYIQLGIKVNILWEDLWSEYHHFQVINNSLFRSEIYKKKKVGAAEFYNRAQRKNPILQIVAHLSFR